MSNCSSFLSCCVLFIIIIIISQEAKGEVILQPQEFHYFCDSNNDRGNFSSISRYNSNLNTALLRITVQAANTDNIGFYSVSNGLDPNKVNAIGQCRGDVAAAECHRCLNETRTSLAQLCPNRKEAIGWYENEKCMLRYSDRTISSLNEIGPAYFAWNLHDAPNAEKFNQVVKNLLDGLRATAASTAHRNYATSSAKGPDEQVIYGLVQCTADLSGSQCDNCLVQSIAEVPRCCNNRIGARIVRPSCYLRYETDFLFYGTTPPRSTWKGLGN